MKHYESASVPIYTKEYMRKYNRAKYLVKKVYPYALYAADLLDEIDEGAAQMKRKRKIKKYYKGEYKNLKEDFKYVILDMYTSEGRMLMKLVHRETGMTVYEIAEKYKGKGSAEVFALMGKMFDQDIDSHYDPKGDDKITEHVIRDIDGGSVSFDEKVNILKKDEYKEKNKKHKENIKKNKKRRKELKKRKKKNLKAANKEKKRKIKEEKKKNKGK